MSEAKRPAYDHNNIFARILRGEIPCDKIHESEHVLAFRDIQPRAPVHVLIIPKGFYRSLTDFSANATAPEQADLFHSFAVIANQEGVAKSGFRVISNDGEDAHQEVDHLHFHLLGGRRLGAILPT